MYWNHPEVEVIPSASPGPPPAVPRPSWRSNGPTGVHRTAAAGWSSPVDEEVGASFATARPPPPLVRAQAQARPRPPPPAEATAPRLQLVGDEHASRPRRRGWSSPMGSTHRRGWSSPLTATSIGRDQAAEAGTRSSGWAMTAATHTMPARRPHFSLTKGLAHRAGQVKGMKNCCFVDFGEERELLFGPVRCESDL